MGEEKIPRSKFTRLRADTLNNYINKAFLYLLLILSGLLALKPEWFDSVKTFVEWDNINFIELFPGQGQLLEYLNTPISKLFISLVWLFMVFKLLVPNFWRFSNSRKTILKLTGGGAEISSEEDASYINQNLGEILYFFEMNKEINIVIFEDLDRLNDEHIFITLREINDIINRYENIKRDVIFIYALRDDMFKDFNDRIKFFDFILPIIPFVDYSNSYNILNRYLNISENNKIESALLKKISYFINDARLLNNIVSEFRVYSPVCQPDPIHSLFGIT